MHNVKCIKLLIGISYRVTKGLRFLASEILNFGASLYPAEITRRPKPKQLSFSLNEFKSQVNTLKYFSIDNSTVFLVNVKAGVNLAYVGCTLNNKPHGLGFTYNNVLINTPGTNEKLSNLSQISPNFFPFRQINEQHYHELGFFTKGYLKGFGICEHSSQYSSGLIIGQQNKWWGDQNDIQIILNKQNTIQQNTRFVYRIGRIRNNQLNGWGIGRTVFEKQLRVGIYQKDQLVASEEE